VSSRRLVFLLPLLGVVLLASGAQPAERSLAVGDPAPDIILSDQHGQSFKLSEALARRRFVVLAFYVKAFTGG
jgi:AhpC/TSA family protein